MLTLRMPATPSNGATMRNRAAVARARASLACATCKLAELSSTERRLMKFCATSSWLRMWLASAIDSSARACCCWANGNWSSSCTISWPRRTFWPSRKLICVTRPLTSGRSMTLWRERKLPTAWASSASRTTSTRPISTAGGRAAPLTAPAAGVAAPREPLTTAASLAGGAGRFWYHQAAPDAAAMPSTAIAVKITFEAMKKMNPAGD